jgi:hypothetical protein
MWVGMKVKTLALRQKLRKLTTFANPELSDHFLTQVIIIVSVFFIMKLNEILGMSYLYSHKHTIVQAFPPHVSILS